MMSARKSSTSSFATACLRCEAVTRLEFRSFASLAAFVTREIMKSSSALAVELVSAANQVENIGSVVRTNSDRGDLRDLADVFIRLHNALDAGNRELCLDFN